MLYTNIIQPGWLPQPETINLMDIQIMAYSNNGRKFETVCYCPTAWLLCDHAWSGLLLLLVRNFVYLIKVVMQPHVAF